MQNQTIERTTLTNLLNNEEYSRKVLPFIKPEYFDVKEERIIFDEIQKFVDKYNKIPTQTSLEIEVSTRTTKFRWRITTGKRFYKRATSIFKKKTR